MLRGKWEPGQRSSGSATSHLDRLSPGQGHLGLATTVSLPTQLLPYITSVRGYEDRRVLLGRSRYWEAVSLGHCKVPNQDRAGSKRRAVPKFIHNLQSNLLSSWVEIWDRVVNPRGT